ncbi:hypothetical protein P7C70_g7904, partial [Phenoliferia sp. Uapishka_3]
LPPPFPIFGESTAQAAAPQHRPDGFSPPSPTLTATELDPCSDGVAPVVSTGRALARQGAVVLDSAIDPELLHPRAHTSSTLPAPPARRSASPNFGFGSNSESPAIAATAEPLVTAKKPSNKAKKAPKAAEEDTTKEPKVVVPRPKDWSDPLATLAYLKSSRAHIADLTKRTNHFKKTFYKMRRDAMALEIQTGCYVGLFVCKSHKNRDDDQHAYNFHFSDTLIQNLVLVDLARNLKREVKAHMLAIWASGVGQGESDLVIRQRKQLADLGMEAGTLRAQVAVASQHSTGQAKAMRKQGRKIKRQAEKVAEMQAKLKALNASEETDDDSSDSSASSDSDSDSSADGGGGGDC